MFTLLKKKNQEGIIVLRGGGDSMCKTRGLIPSTATGRVGEVLCTRVEITTNIHGRLTVKGFAQNAPTGNLIWSSGLGASSSVLQMRGN